MPRMTNPVTGIIYEIGDSTVATALQQGWTFASAASESAQHPWIGTAVIGTGGLTVPHPIPPETPPAYSPEAEYRSRVQAYPINSHRRTIGLGTIGYSCNKATDHPYEGWAKILNLMRTFVKIKKQDAIKKSKQNWFPIEHDIEYLFRYMGLGYTADTLPKPTLLRSEKVFLPKTEIVSYSAGLAIIELPDRKCKKIGEAILEILNHPKCYKELLEIKPPLSAVARDMIAIGTPRHKRTFEQSDLILNLRKHPHIYVFYK